MRPSKELLRTVAEKTGVNVEFFARETAQAKAENIAYRCRVRASAKEKARAQQYFFLLVELLQQMCTDLRPPALTMLKADTDPLKAARFTRTVFGLQPNEPVGHVINVMEKNGVAVLGVPWKPGRIDAFSTWVPLDSYRPVVGVFPVTAGDRLRYSLAHELGHLVMHRGFSIHSRETEDEANRFAAEFLLPEPIMRDILPDALNLAIATELKREWRVSIQMIVRRARDVGAITENRYKMLCKQVGVRGWRTKEPVKVPIERPRLLRQMAEMRYGSSYISDVADSLCISTEFALDLLDQFAPAASVPPNRFIANTEPYTFYGGPNHNN